MHFRCKCRILLAPINAWNHIIWWSLSKSYIFGSSVQITGKCCYSTNYRFRVEQIINCEYIYKKLHTLNISEYQGYIHHILFADSLQRCQIRLYERDHKLIRAQLVESNRLGSSLKKEEYTSESFRNDTNTLLISCYRIYAIFVS